MHREKYAPEPLGASLKRGTAGMAKGWRGCREACPVCGGGYRMQAVDDPERAATNPNPKWEVPIEVIEWQPSYVQKGVPTVLFP